jgi:hypothetical protein
MHTTWRRLPTPSGTPVAAKPWNQRRWHMSVGPDEALRLEHRNINLTGVLDMHHWMKVFDVSADELRKAVQEAGTHADAVREFLSQRQLPLDLSS